MKKIFRLIIILTLVIVLPVNAATTTTTTKKINYVLSTTYANKTGAKLEDNSGYTNLCKRDTSNNYGVTKKWEFNTDYRINRALNTPCVDVNDYVYDFSDVLSEEDEIYIKESLMEFSKEFNMPAIFVSYNLPYTNDKDNEDFIADFYDYNSFNDDDNNYDGIAIFRNSYALDPYVRIMTFGDAQMYLYDSRYDSLISGVKSYFLVNN